MDWGTLFLWVVFLPALAVLAMLQVACFWSAYQRATVMGFSPWEAIQLGSMAAQGNVIMFEVCPRCKGRAR